MTLWAGVGRTKGPPYPQVLGDVLRPQSEACRGAQAWPGSHQHEEPPAAQGPPSGLEGQPLLLPAQQEWDEGFVQRAGIKSRDEKVGHQDIEEINKGLLGRGGSL